MEGKIFNTETRNVSIGQQWTSAEVKMNDREKQWYRVKKKNAEKQKKHSKSLTLTGVQFLPRPDF